MTTSVLDNKSILITGGTGSFGKKMVQIVLAQHKPKRLIVFSRDELKQFEMAQIWSPNKYPCLEYMLGDVRDVNRLMRVMEGVDYVVHSAALKQVPTAERNPEEYIKTNVLGAMNIIQAAAANYVEKVIGLSTDKACNPVNLYGATKLCSDKLFLAENTANLALRTKFAVVRYGNVLGSRGSVIPFFKEKSKTGMLPITDIKMTRFWITLDQAVHLVVLALEKSMGGEIFVPRIPSMRIVDLAKAIAPDCELKVVGIRHGEKIHETLISEDEARNAVQYNRHFVVQNNAASRQDLLRLPEAKTCEPGFRYTSDANIEWLGVEELRVLIENISDDYEIEKSRWAMDHNAT